MAVTRYKIQLLEYKDCPLSKSAEELLALLKAWRKNHSFEMTCTVCSKRLDFQKVPYSVCCQQFYYNKTITCYPVQSIALETPGYQFLLTQMRKTIQKIQLKSNQDFLVFPDPIYWQVRSTLTYEKVLKFVQGLPVTRRTQTVLPPEKSPHFYKQIEEAPLNYGSLDTRSSGKATLIRQIAFGKRCLLSMRGMIVPDPSLRPNEIRIPESIVKTFELRGKWIILNRMPTLQPGNFVALQIPRHGSPWHNHCFAIPLEILNAINGDFDGDECNIYILPSIQSQAECATLLNAEWEMGCFVTGLKLAPSQDMLVAYYLCYDDIDFLPYKHPNLYVTFKVIYELWGSKVTFQAFDKMRQFYLHVLEKRLCFALTLEEIYHLIQIAKDATGFQHFKEQASQTKGCLVTQILAEAKGSFELLYEMFGTIDEPHVVKNSFWTGLNANEAILHAQTSYNALLQTGKIWQPGYGYTKIAYNLQGIKVDYKGRLIDGEKKVIEKDVLDALHYTDVMSKETFQYLVSEVLEKKNFNLC